MKVAITRIDRVVNVDKVYGDGSLVLSLLDETDIYKIHYVLLLNDVDIVEGCLKVNSNKPISFEEGQQIVKDTPLKDIGKEATQ